jgi:hypothetical protein
VGKSNVLKAMFIRKGLIATDAWICKEDLGEKFSKREMIKSLFVLYEICSQKTQITQKVELIF